MNWAQVVVAILSARYRAENPDAREDQVLMAVMRACVVPSTVTALGMLGRNLAVGGALWYAHEQGDRCGEFDAYAARGGEHYGIRAPWSPCDRAPHPRCADIFGT